MLPVFIFFSLTLCFYPPRLRLLDHANSSVFLVRGNYPGTVVPIEHKFYIDYNLWKDSLKDLIRVETKVKLDSFYIIDITLLGNSGTDLERVNAEKKFFQENPGLGEVIHHHIGGSNVNATTLSEEDRNKILEQFEEFDKDDLFSLMTYVNQFMYSNYSTPIVLYWHCKAGVDRVSGSYMMQYKGWTFKKTYDFNTRVKEGLHMSDHNALMMNWYCYWLEMKQQVDLGCSKWPHYV